MGNFQKFITPPFLSDLDEILYAYATDNYFIVKNSKLVNFTSFKKNINDALRRVTRRGKRR